MMMNCSVAVDWRTQTQAHIHEPGKPLKRKRGRQKDKEREHQRGGEGIKNRQWRCNRECDGGGGKRRERLRSINKDSEEERKTKLSKQTRGNKQMREKQMERECMWNIKDVHIWESDAERKENHDLCKSKSAEINWTSRGWKDSWDYRDWLFSRAAFSCTLSQES